MIVYGQTQALSVDNGIGSDGFGLLLNSVISSKDDRDMRTYTNILGTIGRTPLVELRKISMPYPSMIYGKCEFKNPAGSVKDRIALYMIEKAENEGLLKPGGTIVEPTSGNCGIGLAMVAAVKGYRLIVITHTRASREKLLILKAYGAEVVVAPFEAPHDSPESLYKTAERLVNEIPGAYMPNQYENFSNPDIHYMATAKEIVEELGAHVDYFVTGMGTGGTMTGVAKYLKEHVPEAKIIGVDTAGSVISGAIEGHSVVEGIGADVIPGVLDMSLIDEIIPVRDEEAIHLIYRLAREEGILAGASSGAVLFGALEIASRLGVAKNIVGILADTGERYLSKYFSPDWLASNGFSTEAIQGCFHR